MNGKKVVAVFFGGKSAEHDVSVLTGLQIINAIDSTKYIPVPVYISQENNWYCGKELLDRKNYPLSNEIKEKLNKVQLHVGNNSKGRPSLSSKSVFFSFHKKNIEFDIAIPSIHGTTGEDGILQGLFEMASIPYIGYRVLGAAACMDKYFAKQLFKSIGIPVLDCQVIERPFENKFFDVKSLIKNINVKFPACVKPRNLGSSIGVHYVKSEEGLSSAALDVFKLDTSVIIEPFIEDLIEYNVAVTKAFGEIRVSAIERPFSKSEILDFKNKYLANGDMDTKLSVPFDAGLDSATREINPPELTIKQKKSICEWAKMAFEIVNGLGTSRFDFFYDKKTKNIFLCEINPFPGSLAYYLWEAAEPKVTFTELLTAVIEEGINEYQKTRIVDPKIAKSNIFSS